MRRIIMGCAVAICAACCQPVEAGGYRFTNVADSQGLYFHFGEPTINNNGMVAFWAARDDGPTGIYTGPDPVSDAVADTAGAYLSFRMRPAINDSGAVAFQAIARTPQRGGVFTGPNPATDAVADDSGPYLTSSFSGPYGVTINNAGVVAFAAKLSDGKQGIFTGPDPATDALIDESGAFESLGSIGEPAINDAGMLAFSAYVDRSGPLSIYGGPNPATDILVDGAGGIGVTRPSINNSGQIAFWGGGSTGTTLFSGVYRGPDPLQAYADSFGGFRSFEEVDINDSGLVAFEARLDNGDVGIYVGSDPVSDKVVETGDQIFGAAVADVDFFRGFNSRGQIAFRYSLDNRVTGIAIATPIPEPGALGLAAMPALLSLFARRRQ